MPTSLKISKLIWNTPHFFELLSKNSPCKLSNRLYDSAQMWSLLLIYIRSDSRIPVSILFFTSVNVSMRNECSNCNWFQNLACLTSVAEKPLLFSVLISLALSIAFGKYKRKFQLLKQRTRFLGFQNSDSIQFQFALNWWNNCSVQ